VSLLAIDQGNTRTKFGLFVDGQLRDAWNVPTDKTATASDLHGALDASVRAAPTTMLGLCSVVPELLPAWRQFAQECGYPLTVITGESPTPLINRYATPSTLGPDRLMAAVAAATQVGAPVISISLGTAITVDVVSADRRYLGGVIAPGIEVVSRTLASAASALHPVDWRIPSAAIGRTTDEALANGLYFQVIGGLQAMIQAMRDSLHVTAPLALTGGWAAQIAPLLDHVALVDEYLVLHGIAITLAATASSP
jgi:type III pantothenate kinase